MTALRPAADRPPQPDAGGVRATSWRLYAALVLASLAFGALSLLYPSTPSYDPWGWLLWGREILHLNLNTVGANTFKPLPVLFTLPFAVFGKAQPDLWVVIARGGMIFAVVMAFRLAARITIWFGASPAGRHGISRLVAYGPAVLAGSLAGFIVLISPQYIRNGSLGYSECLGAALVLLAIDRHLDDKPRQTFIIGFFPALDRPEIWPFWGLYGLYLWHRDPAARKLIVALFALVPALWFLPEYWGSGHFFRGVQHDLHPTPGAPAYTKCPFCTEMRNAVYISLLRTTIVAGVLALGSAIAVRRALRRRTSGFGTALREQAHRPEGIVLALALLALVWFLEISIMTQYGFSGNQRYMIIGGAPVMVVGGVAVGLVAWKLGQLLGRLIGPPPGAAVAVLAVGAAFLFYPTWAANKFHVGPLNRALHYQAELRYDLSALIRRAGGAKAVLACGRVETENFQVPMVAWYLGVQSVQVANEQSFTGPANDPNVIFQTRVTGTAPLRPVLPTDLQYTETAQRSFRLFEHCR
ncbi:MAG: hypothetical protein M3071_19715 [Actinomycetota bacterium]|nr:hypothetical protein [Actinomycetota bacterium]